MSTTIIFEQIHARLAAHQEAERAVLTPRGEATRTVYRLRTQLAALEPAERAEIIDLAVAELDILGAYPMPQPAERDCPTCPAATA